MTQKKDKTKKLKSISTGNLCSVAQYVAEIVCLRKAEKDNKGSLEYRFWSKSKNKQYKVEVRAAWKLIKKYSEDALLKYINSPSGRNVYSLGFLHKSGRYVLILKFVEKGVADAAKLLKKESKKDKKILDSSEKIEYKHRQSFNSGSTLFSKIRNIEDDERKET
jgi:hypothetical protein